MIDSRRLYRSILIPFLFLSFLGPEVSTATPAPRPADRESSGAAPSGDRTAPPRMAFIPEGPFLLGNTREQLQKVMDSFFDVGRSPRGIMLRELISKRKQKIEIPAYYIDIYEVTNAEYKTFLDATGSPPPSVWENGSYPEGTGDRPVTNVSQREARRFARWAGKRLPTEFEWEKAARGADGRQFPWGDEWKDQGFCNNALQLPNEPTPVGTFETGKSPFGLYDMSGNVWEWTSTYVLPYPGAENTEAFNTAEGFVLRGGSFRNVGHEVRITVRQAQDAHNAFDAVGFRCARSLTIGKDAAAYALDEVAPQLPPDSGIDPAKAMGMEKIARDPETGLITSAHSFALAPVGIVNYSTLGALEQEARKSDGQAALAVLTTDVSFGEPRLAPGDYAVLYQKGTRGAKVAKENGNGEEEGDDDPEQTEAGGNPSAPPAEVTPYDRIIFVAPDGTVQAEIKDPVFTTETDARRSIEVARNLPPVGATVRRAGTQVEGFRVKLTLDPKFGNKSLALTILFKAPDTSLDGWN